MKQIAINDSQRARLLACLKSGAFDVTILPDIALMFERHITFMATINRCNDDRGDNPDGTTYEIDLNRELKISILQALKTGLFPLGRAMDTLKAEASRNLFMECLIQSCNIDEKES
jgi:hypothetical protein